MKRLNRKGFTLIELMAVIAILVIIMGIALPNITSSIERSKEKQKEQKIKLIKSSAELYFDRHNNSNKVMISDLIKDGLLTAEEVKDVGCLDDDSLNCCILKKNYYFQTDPANCEY